MLEVSLWVRTRNEETCSGTRITDEPKPISSLPSQCDNLWGQHAGRV